MSIRITAPVLTSSSETFYGTTKIGVYSNGTDAPDCALVLSVDSDMLSGTFRCSEVVRLQGTETIEVSQGRFSCAIE